jgi:hypothetical protein
LTFTIIINATLFLKVFFPTRHLYEKSSSICLKKVVRYLITVLLIETKFYDQFSEESADEETDSISSSTLKTAAENTGGGGHRPKKITAKSPSRALVNGGGIVAGAGKPKSGVPRKGSWHSHISPYRRSDEVANGGKRSRDS